MNVEEFVLALSVGGSTNLSPNCMRCDTALDDDGLCLNDRCHFHDCTAVQHLRHERLIP